MERSKAATPPRETVGDMLVGHALSFVAGGMVAVLFMMGAG